MERFEGGTGGPDKVRLMSGFRDVGAEMSSSLHTKPRLILLSFVCDKKCYAPSSDAKGAKNCLESM